MPNEPTQPRLIDDVMEMIASGKSNPDIMQEIQINKNYLKKIRQRYNKEHPEDQKPSTGVAAVKGAPAVVKKFKPLAAVGESDLETDFKESDGEYWRAQYQNVSRKYKSLLGDNTVTTRLVEDIKAMAPVSYSPAPKVPVTRIRKMDTSPQSAVLLFSDTHIGKVCHSDQTLGFGHYNMQAFFDRLQVLEQTTSSILTDHVNCEIDELVVIMMGDMLDGNLPHGSELDQGVTKFGQYYAGGHAIAQMLRNLASHFPKVRIETVVGNHTRNENQKKMPTKNRFSNLDMFLYAYCEALTTDIDNIEWNLNMEPFQYFTVKNSVFFTAHGDHLRGGDRALGIPSHALGRQLSNMCQMLGKRGDPNPDYYCFGHFHREMTLPHAKGKIFINGAFPGADEYAMSQNFTSPDPEQKLLLIHPKHKMTANWPIYLAHAEEGSCDYVIPREFL
jgi:hypothetical protein